jgi:hypothetical protein
MASSRSWKGSDYAEPPHGQSPEIKPPVEVMRHNPGYGIMAKFVQGSTIIIDLRREGRLRRNLHMVIRGRIISARAACSEISARRADQRLGGVMQFAFR